jgi:hypothetical protein
LKPALQIKPGPGRRAPTLCGSAAETLALLLCGLIPPASLAQGGPPLVTDDPDTPGNGHWEINIAAIGTHTPGVAQLSLPDADINYGWGDHVQLKIDTPWLIQDQAGAGVKSGLGASELGVKWRFVDQETSGFSMSIYPQASVNFAASSPKRGLTAPGVQWFLPLEASTRFAGLAWDAEVGRGFGPQPAGYPATPDYWAVGLILSRDCGHGLECLAEVRKTLAPHDAQTLLNLGARFKLGESLAIMGAVGRDAGTRSDDRQELLFYLGLQILR